MTEQNASAADSGRATLPKGFSIPLVIALILVFIILGFPWDSLTRRIEHEISVASGARVSIVSLAPAVTGRGPVLRAREVQIEHAAVDRVRLTELEIAPRWSTGWFAGEPRLRVWADSELGLVDGVLDVTASPNFVGRVSRVELARLPLRLDASGVRFSGQLDADADVTLNPSGTLKGRVEFDSPLLIVESNTLPMPIAFSRANGVIVVLENGATQIESLSVEGELIEGDLSGEIGLVHRSQSPPIDFSAKLRVIDPVLRRLAPGAGLPMSEDGEIAVRVRGTLDAPEINPLSGGNAKRGQAQRGTRRARN